MMNEHDAPKLDNIKLRELILYVAMHSEGDRTFGATKLNKLLFFSDFSAFRMHGQSITGADYIKQEHGPVPREINTIRDEMRAEREIGVRTENFYGYEQFRILALREPDLSVFTAVELDVVNRTLELCRDKTASEVSDVSHKFVGWQLADMYEAIPYEASLVGDRLPTNGEIEYGLSLEALAQECLATP